MGGDAGSSNDRVAVMTLAREKEPVVDGCDVVEPALLSTDPLAPFSLIDRLGRWRSL